MSDCKHCGKAIHQPLLHWLHSNTWDRVCHFATPEWTWNGPHTYATPKEAS